MSNPQGAATAKVARNKQPKGVRYGGRAKGTPNRATQEFRETIRLLLDDNRENVALWLGQVAGEDPAKALDLIAKLAEFAAPKLARTEVVGDGGGALIHKVEFEIVDPADKRTP